jgi:hypothetical protein
MSAWADRNPFVFLGGLLVLWFSVFLFGFFASLQGAPAPSYPPPLSSSEYDERLLAIDKEAIDAAYREHVQRMYSGWMKDDTGQPARAVTGVRQAQRAYIASMDAIKRREEEMKRGR